MLWERMITMTHVAAPQAISASCRRRKAGATYLLTAVLIALPIIGTVLSSASAATASKVIAVQLLDATDDPSMAGMQLTIDQDTVPAGLVTVRSDEPLKKCHARTACSKTFQSRHEVALR